MTTTVEPLTVEVQADTTKATEALQALAKLTASVAVPRISWTDPPAIAAYFTSTTAAAIGTLTELGVIVPSGTSGTVSTWAGIASLAVAAVVQVVHIVTHRGVQKAAITAVKLPQLTSAP